MTQNKVAPLSWVISVSNIYLRNLRIEVSCGMVSTPNSSPANRRNCAPGVSTPCRTMLRRLQSRTGRSIAAGSISSAPPSSSSAGGLSRPSGNVAQSVPQASPIPSHIGLSPAWYVSSSLHKLTRQSFAISPTSFGHNFSKMNFFKTR